MGSRSAAEKNLELAIRAFRAIRELRADAKMVLVGDGPQRAALSREHPEIILAGMRIGDELASHYASADMFLFPSLTETFGNVTLEAMASGLCVVAYDYAAAAEVIDSERNGLTAPRNDDAGFVAQAVRAATDRSLRLRTGAQARLRAETLDWDAVNDQFAAALMRVWRSSPGSFEASTAGDRRAGAD